MNYEKAKEYLQSFVSFEELQRIPYQDFDLGRIKTFMREFGVKYEKLKFVHVAGSKGKGSTCRMIADYLWRAGLRVGLYTSPHMIEVTERFWLNGLDIGKRKFVKYVEELKQFVEGHIVDGADKSWLYLTYFEILTVIALKFFVDEGVDYAILEVGLGGRLDATNVVRPELSVITTVEMEHVGILGNNLSEILDEKLGIVKDGVSVLIGKGEALKLAEKKLCNRKDVFYVRDFKVKFSEKTFTDKARFYNACTAFAALKILLKKVDEKKFLKIATELRLPGRFDIRVVDGRTVVFDLAHTINSIENLINALKMNFPGKKFIFLLAIMRGKDVSGILKLIGGIADKIVFTTAHERRGILEEELLKIAKELDLQCLMQVSANCVKAYSNLLKSIEKGVVLVITGSHFLVGKLLR